LGTLKLISVKSSCVIPHWKLHFISHFYELCHAISFKFEFLL
jgi:hypothetical protein